MTATPSASPAGLDSIGQIAINVKSMTRAVAFYRDVLGIQFLFEAPPSLAFFRCGDVSLMLGTAESAEFDHPSSVIYFNSKDITASHAMLAERGVKFRDEPHLIHTAGDRQLWMTFFDDTEGNTLAIQQWRVAA